MSACQRKISRLPISVFQDLITRPPLENRDDDPKTIKADICNRLKRFRMRNVARNKHKNQRRSGAGISSPTTTACSIKTIGQLLCLSKYTIMTALDPILTYEEVEIFLRRVCDQCGATGVSALSLLRATNEDATNGLHIPEPENDSAAARPQYEEQKPLDDINPVSFGNQMRLLPTSLPSLDHILRGGIRLATITELVGRSGVGKTQLAFQLCITAAKFNQGAIYIDTEKKLSLERLKEMSELRRLQDMQGSGHEIPNIRDCNDQYFGNYANEDALATFKSGEIVLDNLTIHQPGNSEELLGVLDELEYEILIRNQSAGGTFIQPNNSEGMNITSGTRSVRGRYPVRLLVVDSIAAPIRRDFGMGSAPKRAATVFQCAQKLKRLADQLHMAIVVINQVGSSDNDFATSNLSHDVGNSEHHHVPVRAALGASWHHCVSTRLTLETNVVDEITPDLNDDNLNHSNSSNREKIASRVLRKIAVTKSNLTGFGETHFDITSMGIVEI